MNFEADDLIVFNKIGSTAKCFAEVLDTTEEGPDTVLSVMCMNKIQNKIKQMDYEIDHMSEQQREMWMSQMNFSAGV